MTKQQKLIKLREKIIDEVYKKRWEEVWFFPEFKEVKGVRGFLGTDPIIFCSINPSFGAYPSKVDLFYYETLKKQGFSNAHLTDVFKIKRRNKEVKALMHNKNLVAEAKRILKQEMLIIEPKLVVCVGRSYKDFYNKIMNELGYSKIEIIPHYAQLFDNPNKRKRFRAAMRCIKKNYKKVIFKK